MGRIRNSNQEKRKEKGEIRLSGTIKCILKTKKYIDLASEICKKKQKYAPIAIHPISKKVKNTTSFK